jgi:hypothetical protein
MYHGINSNAFLYHKTLSLFHSFLCFSLCFQLISMCVHLLISFFDLFLCSYFFFIMSPNYLTYACGMYSFPFVCFVIFLFGRLVLSELWVLFLICVWLFLLLFFLTYVYYIYVYVTYVAFSCSNVKRFSWNSTR